MAEVVELDVSPERIQASLRSLGEQLVLREHGGTGNLQRVNLTKKHSTQPIDEAIEALFFTMLGTFPLVELELNFDNQVAMSCTKLATTIQGSRATLKKLKLSRMTLARYTESLILALRDHPCLLNIEFYATHTLIGFPHDALIRCLRTCPCLENATFYWQSEVPNTLGPALSDLCSKPSFEVLYLGKQFGAALVSQVCQELHQNTNLQQISIVVGNSTRTEADTALQCIGNMLVTNNALKYMILQLVEPISRMALSMRGTVTNALKSHNRTLKGFWLYSATERRPWSSDTIHALEGMLEENTVLDQFGFVSDGGDGECVENPQQSNKIPFYLKLNNLGRRRFLEERPTQEEWANVIISNQEDVPVVFYFLSLNPSLLKGQGSPIGMAEESLRQLEISED